MASVPDQPERPPNLLYAVDEWPPPLRLVLLGFQYAVMAAIYLILVAIILRHAHVMQATRVDAMSIACVGLAIGTALQALPRGPVGSGFLAPPVFSAVYLAPSVLAAEIGGMPLVFGMKPFRELPAAVRSFTNSPLALCLSAAIALTLLFRLGAAQAGEIAWNDSEDSIASAVGFLRGKAQDWKVAADLVETSAAHAGEFITYILENHSRHPEGALRAVYNGVELRVDIVYQGTQTAHLPTLRDDYIPIESELENEEAVAYVGLRNFLRGLAVDRQQIKIQKRRVMVRLCYAV